MTIRIRPIHRVRQKIRRVRRLVIGGLAVNYGLLLLILAVAGVVAWKGCG